MLYSSPLKLHVNHYHYHYHHHHHHHHHGRQPWLLPAQVKKPLLMRIRSSSSSASIPIFNQPQEQTDSSTKTNPNLSTNDNINHKQKKKNTISNGAFSIPISSSVLSSQYNPSNKMQALEEAIEQAIFNCRFLTLMGVAGSLAGSILCFFKGCSFVVQSFVEYYQTCWHSVHTGKVILLLVEAVDVYLMGTVMLIFGMGLYELFVNSLEVPAGGKCAPNSPRTTICGSNLFGLFRLRERPKWLEIHSLDELKTKIGHVIVMILLVGMFDKSKKVPIHSGLDLLCFSASILLSSGSLFLLSKLHSTN